MAGVKEISQIFRVTPRQGERRSPAECSRKNIQIPGKLRPGREYGRRHVPTETFRMEKKEGEEPDNIYGIADSGYDSMAAAGTASVCRIVKAPEQWMSPLVDFIPGSLLAAYQAAVREHNFFNGRYDFRTETWVS